MRELPWPTGRVSLLSECNLGQLGEGKMGFGKFGEQRGWVAAVVSWRELKADWLVYLRFVLSSRAAPCGELPVWKSQCRAAQKNPRKTGKTRF